MLLATQLVLFTAFFCSVLPPPPRSWSPLPLARPRPTFHRRPSSPLRTHTFLPVLPIPTASRKMASLRRKTYAYKELRGVDLKLDAYLPTEGAYSKRRSASKGAPVLVYYHGGGMCAGNRDWNDWVQKWLFRGLLAEGWVVVSFDYTLIAPDTAYQIIKDVQDGIEFVAERLNRRLEKEETAVRIDPSKIVASGASGGGTVAYYAGHHSPVRLAAIVSLYGEGGDFMLDWTIKPKTEPFCLGAPLITDLAPFEALRDQPKDTPPVVYTPLEGGDPTRSQFYFYLLQTAQALDVFTGIPGLSARLLPLSVRDRDDAVPPEARGAVPHLGINGAYPPTFLLHGDRDSIVPVEESRNMARVLREKGVEVRYEEIEGGEHGFDMEGAWAGNPGGQDPVLTKRKDEALKAVIPWLLERVK